MAYLSAIAAKHGMEKYGNCVIISGGPLLGGCFYLPFLLTQEWVN